MIEYVVIISSLFFILTLIPGRHVTYAAMGGWISIVIVFLAGIPEYLSQNNILYPVLALLSLPFLWITLRLLYHNEKRVFELTRAAAVAFILYAPFAFFPVIGDWLIAMVVDQTLSLLKYLNYPAYLADWNTIQHGIFKVEIILACTGIQSIAIMLGVVAAVPTTTRQKILAFLLVVPSIYILNLFRNAGVIIAYTDQWFPFFTDLVTNGEFGFESFFWAHNIIAEGLALLFLIALAYYIFRLIPTLADCAIDLITIYKREVRNIVGRGT